MPDLTRPVGQPTNIFDRHLALEEAIVGSPLTTGNQVLLLKDDPATYDAMLASNAIVLTEWERRTLDLRMQEAFARAWAYWL